MVDIIDSKWNEADASNTNASPNGLQGGYAPNAIAPTIRQVMGALKRFYVQNNAIYTSTGSASNYVLTYAVAPAALTKGIAYMFWPNHTNTGAATLNINALGAKAIVRNDGAALTAGQITSGNVVSVVYDGTRFRLQSPTTNPTFTGQVDVGSLVSAGPVSVAGAVKAQTTGGSVAIQPGNDTRSGFIEFRQADTTRAGYIGYADDTTSTINLLSENGYTYNASNGFRINNQLAWHAGNDGAGSGLDADLLDGQQSAFYLSASNLNAGTLPNARLSGAYDGITLSSTDIEVTGSTWSTSTPQNAGFKISGNAPNIQFRDTSGTKGAMAGVNSDAFYIYRSEGDGLLTGVSLAVPLTGTGNMSFNGATVWTSANDGAGSGLDADTIRGIPAVTLATKDLTVNAGNGITGGGMISSHPTLTLGTPGTITNTTTNTVSASSHTHALTLVAGDITGALGFTPARAADSILAGNGITGGGTMGATRTITLGTPGAITATSTNSVTTTSHTHDLDMGSAPLRNDPETDGSLSRLFYISDTDNTKFARIGAVGLRNAFDLAYRGLSITAGNGMSGGGTLEASRTITLGTPGTITGSSTNSVTSTSHTHTLTLVSGDITGALGFTPPPNTRQVIAGNGLSGGGSMGVDRTITMGTPGSITNATTNSVTTTSHTHALGFIAAEVFTGSSAATTAFPLGHMVYYYNTTEAVARNGLADPALRTGFTASYISASHSQGETALAGTWRSRGAQNDGFDDWTMAQRVA